MTTTKKYRTWHDAPETAPKGTPNRKAENTRLAAEFAALACVDISHNGVGLIVDISRDGKRESYAIEIDDAGIVEYCDEQPDAPAREWVSDAAATWRRDHPALKDGEIAIATYTQSCPMGGQVVVGYENDPDAVENHGDYCVQTGTREALIADAEDTIRRIEAMPSRDSNDLFRLREARNIVAYLD